MLTDQKPFVGKPAVRDFVEAFEIPGCEFVLQRLSEGERSCVFVWEIMINGEKGPKGISFYEVNSSGRVSYVRDIPSPFPRGFRPLGYISQLFSPATRKL